MKNKSTEILITGAASGLGEALALEAHRRGHRVHLTDVSPAVEKVAARVGGRHLIVDLSERGAAEKIAAWAPNVDVIVNNAGVAAKADFQQMDPRKAESTVVVNVLAPVLLCRIFLEKFYQRGGGTIVNVSSSAGYFPTPGLATYGPSKSFLTSFTETLIAEGHASAGVAVIGVCPSGMRTNFQAAAGVRNERPQGLLDPGRVASWVLDKMESGRPGIWDYGVSTHVWTLLRRFLPRGLYRRLLGALMRRYR